jgi:hypothetical protein
MKLDKLTLDEMVQGIESENSVWTELLSHPEAEQLWSNAVKRREKLDAFCRFVVKWPSLVTNYNKVKSFAKKSFDAPSISILSSISNPDLFSATLNNAQVNAESSLLEVAVEWGTQQVIELGSELKIKFNTEALISIYYSYNSGDGWINSSDAWDFLPHEGAVLLTFVDADSKSNELELVLRDAKSVATIVLLPS